MSRLIDVFFSFRDSEYSAQNLMVIKGLIIELTFIRKSQQCPDRNLHRSVME
jgi:hypothetical protein